MEKQFSDLMTILPFKTKSHYCFDKTVWVTDECVYKHYIIKNEHQLKKFVKNFKVFSEINENFKYLFHDSVCYVITKKTKNNYIDYELFLKEIETMIVKYYNIKDYFICFEDLQRNNYFFDKELIPIDESKIFVCKSRETWYTKSVHALVEGYKNEIKYNHLDPDEKFDQIIYQISKNLYNLIESKNSTSLGSQ